MYKFTSESVSEGHPDKLADQISDALLDEYLRQDKSSKVAVETMVTPSSVYISGEVKSSAIVDVEKITRAIIRSVGYDKDEYGFNADNCNIVITIHEQSSDIAQGVEKEEQGAGDQGIMFGYATNETADYMPLTLMMSHHLMHELSRIRHEKEVMTYLRPDSKSQVTILYDDKNKPLKVDTILISTQHDDDVSQEKIYDDIKNILIPRVIKKQNYDKDLFNDYKLLVNPTGKFVIGGPAGDTGLTGRKIIVDTYGGVAPHGGGAFSGKDPSKVDRSAAYMARFIAKNCVAKGLCDKILIQLSYAIGVAQPTSLYVNTYNTAHNGLTDEDIVELIYRDYDLTPKGIINKLDLLNPIYLPTSTYGHFGRTCKDGFFTWENIK